MFVLSKIFWLVANPGNILLGLLAAGTVLLFTRFRRSGRTLVAVATGLFLLLGVFPFGSLLTEALENRFPANPALPAKVDGIVALGGTVIAPVTEARRQPSLTDGSERLIEFVRLARRYPEARLVFSGGSGSLTQPHLKETEVVRELFRTLGFDDSDVVYESRSRNTYENALYSKQRVRPQSGETWVLVTSAAHMPRAVGTFRAAGWRGLIPYPVDFATDGSVPFNIGLEPLAGVRSLSSATHEWIGLLAYRILGRTDVLFPGPADLADN